MSSSITATGGLLEGIAGTGLAATTDRGGVYSAVMSLLIYTESQRITELSIRKNGPLDMGSGRVVRIAVMVIMAAETSIKDS